MFFVLKDTFLIQSFAIVLTESEFMSLSDGSGEGQEEWEEGT